MSRWALRPGSEDNHSSPFSAKVKSEWSYTPTAPSWCGMGKLYFYQTVINYYKHGMSKVKIYCYPFTGVCSTLFPFYLKMEAR
jgi:hypothetical protein